jgi:hypothetical protein
LFGVVDFFLYFASKIILQGLNGSSLCDSSQCLTPLYVSANGLQKGVDFSVVRVNMS